GLRLATGAWIALLSDGDLLAEHALYCAANAINADSAIRLIYSDEDKIDADNKRHDHYFKPDWNVDLFHSHDLFTRLGLWYKPLVDAVGGFRDGMAGAESYDLTLRCIEQVQADAIYHVRRVLYHARTDPDVATLGADAVYASRQAGMRALEEHFSREKIDCLVTWSGYGYRTHYRLPAVPPLVSLIIPTRNGLEFLRMCITSIFDKTTYANFEIVIVDNGSDDAETLAYLSSLVADHRVRVLRDDGPFNYSALNNKAVNAAQGEIVGLINNDIEVISPDWLAEMVSLAIQPQVGAVGARLLYPNDTLQHGGVVLGIGGMAGHAHKFQPASDDGYGRRSRLIGAYSAVTAACLLVRRATYLELGGLDETNLAVAYNDVDFCLRLREAGYRNVWTPYAEMYHHESATRGYEDDPIKRARAEAERAYMRRRWGDALADDPAYSPNLTVDAEDFDLAWPPRVAALA
ncbi:MAG: glycosyltransferase family 2 protein, partial [Janthinobacterium lividum]